MAYLGSWALDDFLTWCVNTHNPATGAAADAAAPPSYRIYEDETAVPILTGAMALLDDANTTGFYSERIQLTATSGFEKSRCYTIYMQATVAGTVVTFSHTFQIEAAVNLSILSTATVPVVSVASGGAITVRPYTTWIIPISGLGSLAGRTALYFTVKTDPDSDVDSEAMLQVEETAGLLRVNGAAAAAINGSLLVTDAVNGDLTVTINKAVTGLPRQAGMPWDVKIVTAAATKILGEGEFNIGQAVTYAIA